MLEEAVCVWCNQEQSMLQFQRESWSSWHRFFFIPECLHPSLFQSRPQTNTALSLMRLMHHCLRTTKIIFHLHFTITINHCFSYCISNHEQRDKPQRCAAHVCRLRSGCSVRCAEAQTPRPRLHNITEIMTEIMNTVIITEITDILRDHRDHHNTPGGRVRNQAHQRNTEIWLTTYSLSLSHPIIWLYYQSRNKRIQKMQLK